MPTPKPDVATGPVLSASATFTENDPIFADTQRRDLVRELQERAGEKDAKLWLSEWLAYGAERVPSLYEEVRTGRAPTPGGQRPRLVGPGAAGAQRILEHGSPDARRASQTQHPALFDFSRKRRDVSLDR